ncbi:MAG: fimbrial protein [Bacteroidaceae bacterium]
MYKINTIWIIAVFSLLLTTACTDFLGEENERVIEGKPTLCTLRINASDNTVLSRATSPDKVEKDINNLFIFIFQNGNIVSSKYFEKQAITTVGATGSITLATTSGNDRHIYAIANLDLGMMNLTKADLEKVTNETDLNALNACLLQEITARGTSFVMSGFVEGTGGAISNVSIPATSNTSTALGTIKLKKLDSKIQFNIATKQGVIFTPRDWRVVKVPKNASLFTSTSDKFTQETDYFNTAWANLEGQGANIGKTFSFYVLENMNTPSKQIPIRNLSGGVLTADERYAYRELQDKIKIPEGSQKPGQTVVNGNYTYANQNATYVQLRGHVLYLDGTSTVSADVIYTIHLGYAGADPNDYNTLRNTFYTYTVTINSINDISVEVINDQETQPGAEGVVTLATELYTFDAHYESTSVAFPSAIMNESLTWYVQTAFDKGGANEHPKDYKWILFELSTKPSGGVYSKDLVFYPGDAQKYTSATPITLDYYIAHPTTLLDVEQLITILKENGKRLRGESTGATLFDSDNKIRFTAFVNENYYKTNPLNGNASTELWKLFVNQPERMLNILTGTSYSHDGASMHLKAVYSFRQASIQTMYSVDYNDLSDTEETAWGCEALQDTKTYPKGVSDMPSTGATDHSNGRNNTLTLWNGIVNTADSWNTCITESTREFKTAYDKIKYTCLKKNRDGNGNKQIDSDEVQWYLASINQLTDIWLGEKSLDLKSRLHEGINTGTNTYNERTYISSSMAGNNQPWILWSSEGSSIGADNGGSEPYYYRCVRNLGMADNATTSPKDFATFIPDATGTTLAGHISLKKMNRKSIRSYTQVGDLQEHHERQSDNLPWTEFEILKAFTASGNWSTLDANIKAGTKVCADGYRVPNQRELSLMYSRMGDGASIWSAGGSNYYFCRTKFSLNSNRSSLAISPQGANMCLFSGRDNTGVVRCVKDVQ